MSQARLAFAGLIGLVTACDGSTDLSTDALAEHCEARCEFQATCVPELRDIIGECIRQCSSSFEDTDKYVRECTLSDVRLPNDPSGPYVLHTVVTYQQCVIASGCAAAAGTCDETRELCLDTLDPMVLCRRDRDKRYQACQDDREACYAAAMANVCEMRVQRCYDEARARFATCE